MKHPSRDWMIFEGERHIDTVTFVAHMTGEEVRQSLIKNDGYPEDITIREIEK